MIYSKKYVTNIPITPFYIEFFLKSLKNLEKIKKINKNLHFFTKIKKKISQESF